MYDGEWKFGSFIKGKLFTEVKNLNCKFAKKNLFDNFRKVNCLMNTCEMTQFMDPGNPPAENHCDLMFKT